MANPITQETFTFATAALATGASPKTIRNWLDKNQVLLDANEHREKGKWRRFSMWDVLRLALAKRLVDFGVPVELASEVVGGILAPHMVLRTYKNTPPAALAASLKHTVQVLWHDDKGWDGETLRSPGGAPRKAVPDSIIQIDVGRIVASVIGTLAEAARLELDDIE